MILQEISKQVAVIDSAIGPFIVETAEVSGFDVDAHVKTTIESQAIFLQVKNSIAKADPRFAKNRPPVIAGDVGIGGYNAG